MSVGLILVVALILVVLANVVLEVIAKWRNPPIGKFLEIDGARLHYIDRGSPDSPPLVMFHGNGTLIQDLIISGLVDNAAGEFRVICFDRPGFGHSTRPRSRFWSPQKQAELFAAALDQVGVKRAVVLGHSWGALVALAMAAQKPELVKGLVLVSGYYFPSWRIDAMFASTAAIPLLGDALRYTISPVSTWLALPFLAKKAFAPKRVPEIVKREYPRLLLLRPGQLRAVAEDSAFLLPGAASLTGIYQQLDCPTAIIAGLADEVVNSDQALRLEKSMRRATVTRVPELGHMLHYFVAEEIVRSAALINANTV